jgi:DNA-binding SARP family transcriptional activator
VEIEGMQVADQLRGKQVPLLLAYLLLNRSRQLGRAELSEALWPRQAPRSREAALRTLLSRLRAAIGQSALSGRDELALDLPEPVWIDLEAASLEVEHSQDALERGDARGAWALAQVPLNIASRGLLPGARADWLEPPRRELEDIRLHALEVIGRAGLSMGGTQLASAQRAARNLIETEPYRESGYVLLMEALAAEGNVAEGMRVFERLRTLLREELGTAPSPAAISAHERLLRPSPMQAVRSGRPQAVALALPGELVARASVPLVGRKLELEELGRLWELAQGGAGEEVGGEDHAGGPVLAAGRIVMLAGDPGIGKTRLAAELARTAHEAGALVLAGRAPEQTVVPYQPFLEALRHYFTRVPVGELRLTAREYAPELARLVPELRRRAPDLPPPLSGDPETERYRLFEAVVGLLRTLSERTPVLLVLDDLHWADRPTLLLLRHLARTADPARLLVLGAYSSQSEVNGFSQALSDLRRERLIVQLPIEGLGERETAELVRLRTGEIPSRSFVRALQEETEGNPFFIEEIVRHLADAGVKASAAGAGELQRFGLPEGVKEVIARRLARLDSSAMECLRVGAVIGRDFDVALLEQVVSLEEEEFVAGLEGALAAGLLVQSPADPARLSFSHALVRETLYDGMSAPRRSRSHRRVGEALEASPRREKELAALAHHFASAAGVEDAERAITYSCRAGDHATAMLAHEDAVGHYARALEVLQRFQPQAVERRCELLLLVGEARVRGGERALAWPAFREAAALAESLGDSARLTRAATGASRRYVQQPGVVEEELIAMLDRAREMTSGERTVDRVRLLARLCGALYFSPQRNRMPGLSEEAAAIAEELGDPEALAYARAARRRALWDAAHLDERLEASTEMLTLARQVTNLELQLQAHAWLVVDLLEHGDSDAVDAQIEVFAAGAEQLRQPLYIWNALVWRAMRALLAGRLRDADELAGEALAAGASAEAVTAPQYYAIQLLAIRREQGRLPELEEAARQQVGGYPALTAWRAALAMVLWETGKVGEARDQYELLAAQDFRDIPQGGDWLTTMILLSDVCVGLGDAVRAEALYEALMPYEGSNVVIGLAAVCLGSAARFLGKLAATIGRAGEARGHFERALEANAKLQSPVFLAHTQLDYAQALGRERSASKLIAAAERTAAELGLPAVGQRAEALGDS